MGQFYSLSVKRGLDIGMAVILLLVFWPLLLVIGFLICMKLGAPVLFYQTRPGLHGKPFNLIEFRSMTDAHDTQGNLLPADQRITPFGRFLRSTSLDELPELWNVLRGDMSLVGPRPLLLDYLPLYTPEQNRRHNVLPGLTGWAQVRGCNALSWEEKFALDTRYVEHTSLVLDVRILLLTTVSSAI